MKKDLAIVKIKLIEFGYLDNEWLDRYLAVIEANLGTRRNRKSTQAHHVIPVNSYWASDEPYNRKEALKLVKADNTNFVVHLLYKDHLVAHSYLTLCTDLEQAQRRYEAQSELRKDNSRKASDGHYSIDRPSYKMRMPKNITEEKILVKLATYDAAQQKAADEGDAAAEDHYITLVKQWKSRYAQFLEDPSRYTNKSEATSYIKNDTYHSIAKKKRELRTEITRLHKQFNEAQLLYGKNSSEAMIAKSAWKSAIEAQANFVASLDS